MKASEAKLLDLLRKSPQFVIPIYQRTYSWTEKECQQLWEDILRAGRREDVAAHFVGSIVYVEQGLYQVSSQSPLLVIDGQQRLTTVTILIAALGNALDAREENDREPVEGFSPRKLRNYYLLNPEEDGERHYKLILSQNDKDTLIAKVANKPMPSEPSLRVEENFGLFQNWIAQAGSDLNVLCQGLAKLVVVDISLTRDQDNPQLIFESMNSTGRELTQADLIRNFILMGLEPKIQTRLYNDYWRPMEKAFGQEGYGQHFDAFMRFYLTLNTGEIPKIREVYEAFKVHARSPEIAEAGTEALVADIRRYAGHFCAMALGSETDSDLKRAFHDLRELKVDVTYPLLLELYEDYTTSVLSKQDLLEVIRLVESFVFRRAICNIPTSSLRLIFANFRKALKKDRYVESIKAHFLSLPSYRRFPTDDEFCKDLQVRDLYNFPRRSYWLRRMENFDRKERIVVDEFTIEHILPQNENPPDGWKEALGPEWEHIRETYVHTLGNLTLTGYNSEYGDKPFANKRDMKGGFKESTLRLNEGLGQLETWNEETIKARAAKLAAKAATIWKMPTLPPEVLETYRPKRSATSASYSIEDHPHLLVSPIKEVFEAFRREVLALDPCVFEDVLKQYVAFKAERNFVDVIPQAKRLRLILNMSYPEITDPKGLCEDLTGLGRWGNGDVRLSVKSLEELPYVIGLVRQSLELQLGDAESAEN